jgi:type II secretory pathway pseudopilin PulG
MNRQRGSAFILFVVVLAVIGVSMILGATTLQADTVANHVAEQRQDYLHRSTQQIERWYQSHLAIVDLNDDPPAIASILSEAGFASQFGAKVAVSQRQFNGDTAYRVFVVWIPNAMPDTSAFNNATGQFTPAPGVQYALLNGLSLQSAAMSATRNTINAAAISLENYFTARTELNGKDVSVNQFRPDTACSGTVAGFPCIDTYTDASAIDWSMTGIDPVRLVDAWGNPLEVSNLLDSQTTNPPYSMSIRAKTPFGTFITMSAIQRL